MQDKSPLFEYLGGQRIRLIDVGARSGIAERWNRFTTMLEVIGFEPDEEECVRLNATNASAPYPITFLPFALGAVDDARATMNLCRQPGCSSLFHPNLELASGYPYGSNLEVVGTYAMTLHRLDTVLAARQLPPPDVIKVDTQGSELDILRGAGSLLREIPIVELEVEFVEQYLGQPLFADVDAFMRAAGFTLRGIRRTSWRRTAAGAGWPQSSRGGQLIHGDALYINDGLLNRLPAAATAQMFRILVCLSAYRQDDLCLHLLSRPHAALAHWSEPDRQQIARLLIPRQASVFARVLSGVRASQSSMDIRGWVDSQRPKSATDWNDPDFY